MKIAVQKNCHITRESWLKAATDELRPYFEKLGYVLPDKIRFAMAFTSTGKRGQGTGECWHPEASADQHYEIIIRADIDDPVEVLSVLVHELVHTLLTPEVRHGKEFRKIAMRVGLEGQMRHTTANQILADRLNSLAINLGSLPHAKLNFAYASDVPAKQTTRMLKAECGAACGYTIRLSQKWANAGLPVCPINHEHGVLMCDAPDINSDETIRREGSNF